MRLLDDVIIKERVSLVYIILCQMECNHDSQSQFELASFLRFTRWTWSGDDHHHGDALATVRLVLLWQAYLFDSSDGWDVVDLGTPLVITVVLSTFRHVPQVLTAPEVLLIVTNPSAKDVKMYFAGFSIQLSNDTSVPNFSTHLMYFFLWVIDRPLRLTLHSPPAQSCICRGSSCHWAWGSQRSGPVACRRSSAAQKGSPDDRREYVNNGFQILGDIRRFNFSFKLLAVKIVHHWYN